MLNLDDLEVQREKASEDKADLFDFYNKHWDTLVAELRRLQGSDPTEVCDECGKTIPANVDLGVCGSLANKHHDESCSLYDSDVE